MKAKLQQLQSTLSKGLVGRDEIMKSALLGVIAGENTLLIGPPGTAKSMLARRVSEAIRQDETQDYFEYLLTKFSTPEEIFGPLSISELKQDRFQRNTTGYLPSVRIGFLDEIFKASSSILNALLTILNERKYHNGTQSVDVPLQSLISASNELPIGQEELSALYDRFLIRRFVGYVGQEQLSALFDLPKIEAVDEQVRLTVDELQQIREQAKNVQFGNDVRQAIQNIWKNCQSEFKENKDEQLSDRRFVKVLHLMRISAITNGRNTVDFSDILLLKDCLWNNPDNQEKILHIIKTELKKYDKLVDDVDSAEQWAVRIDDEPIQTVTKTPSQNVIKKRLQGSGTVDDPFLIENYAHLQMLMRADAGQKGYHFLQVADIDCSKASSWATIPLFIGHYNGNGYEIRFKKSSAFLFETVQDSTVENVSLQGLMLCYNFNQSKLFNCIFGLDFIVGKDSSAIITESRNSTIEKCFVNGKIYCSGDERYTGLVKVADNSKIMDCAIDFIEFEEYRNMYSRIVTNQKNNTLLQNNISTDLNYQVINLNNRHDSKDGVSISASDLTEDYYANALQWDFDTIWQWDNTANCPTLRKSSGIVNYSGSNTVTTANTTNISSNQNSLLKLQMQSNIWL